MTRERKIIIVAGPNGAGKTTFARQFLPREADCPVFINADLIAAGLSPFRPEAAELRAGRILLAEISNKVARRESFAFESTLAGRGYARSIPRWRAAGYHVKIVFLSLPDAAACDCPCDCPCCARRARRSGGCHPPAIQNRVGQFPANLSATRGCVGVVR